MYSRYYGFREDPFSLLPDPDFLFLSQKHETALNLLEMAILNQSAFSVISGDIGTGKTTLIRVLLNRLDSELCVGLISNTHADFTDLLPWVLSAYDQKAESADPVSQYQQFSDYVSDQYANGKHTLLIIDEAHNLSVSALEALRMLSNINTSSETFFQIMLVGQTELLETLRKPELAQLTQRVSVAHHLTALSEIETEAYIQHRLRTAGGAADIFDSKACQLIYRYSRGIPRLINKLCDLSLVYGFAQEIPSIGVDIVRSVVQEHKPMGIKRAADAKPANTKPQLLDSVPHKVGILPVKRKAAGKDETANNKKNDPHYGDKPMTDISQQHASSDKRELANSETPDTEAVTAAAPAPAPEEVKPSPPAPSPEEVQLAARTAAEEKAAAEHVAIEKSEIARKAIQKAAADRAAVEAAKAEKVSADKLAADKTAADRLSTQQAEATRAAAEQAKADLVAAEKALEEKTAAAAKAAELLAEVKQSGEKMVADEVSKETVLQEKAAAAARLAEEAAAASAAAAAEAQQALLQRVSAEKVAADKLATAERTAAERAADLESAQETRSERVNVEQEAISKAEAARIAAEEAAREKGAAVKDSQEKRSIAKQTTQQAEMTRAAAEKAAAELEAAEKIAADKEQREKVALADVAASLAAEAQKEAEAAEAAQAAALELARRKQAIAKEAARKAAEASLAVKKDLGVVPTTVRISEKVKQATEAEDELLNEGVPAPILEQQKRKPGKTWMLMTITAVVAGVTGWLVVNRTDLAGAVHEVMAEKDVTLQQPAVSAAALEVKEVAEK